MVLSVMMMLVVVNTMPDNIGKREALDAPMAQGWPKDARFCCHWPGYQQMNMDRFSERICLNVERGPCPAGYCEFFNNHSNFVCSVNNTFEKV